MLLSPNLSFDFSKLMPVVISTVVVMLILFSLYVAIKYRDTEQYKKTRLNVFFSTLASVAIIFVSFNIILTSISFKYNQQFIRLTKTREAADKLWIFPNELLQNSTAIRPEFKVSFYMNSPETYKMVDPTIVTPLTTLGAVQEQFIANVIVQAWEDCLAAMKYDLTSFKSWLIAFITWAQSPYLREYHNIVKFSYEESTNLLAELLFEYAATLPVPVKDTSLYIAAVDRLMLDPRYQTLMKML